jgi:hypothetical protein
LVALFCGELHLELLGGGLWSWWSWRSWGGSPPLFRAFRAPALPDLDDLDPTPTPFRLPRPVLVLTWGPPSVLFLAAPCPPVEEPTLVPLFCRERPLDLLEGGPGPGGLGVGSWGGLLAVLVVVLLFPRLQRVAFVRAGFHYHDLLPFLGTISHDASSCTFCSRAGCGYGSGGL